MNGRHVCVGCGERHWNVGAHAEECSGIVSVDYVLFLLDEIELRTDGPESVLRLLEDVRRCVRLLGDEARLGRRLGAVQAKGWVA